MSLGVALEQQRQYYDQVSENSARLARAAVSYLSSGSGEVALTTPVQFGVTFLEAPSVATGVVFETGAPVYGKFPNCCAGVWKWERSQAGYYVGAYLFFVVDSGGQAYNLRHQLVFEGEAIKLLSAEALA